jgi:hypothetical protein
MDPLAIVVALHICEEVTTCLISGGLLPLVDEFHLQGLEEALHRCIIVAVACCQRAVNTPGLWALKIPWLVPRPEV